MSNIADAKLVKAVKQAAGQLLKDYVEIFTGIVVDNSQASIDGTISVQQISGIMMNNLLYPIVADSNKQEPDLTYEYFNNQQFQSSTYQTQQITADTAQNVINNGGGAKIWQNVELQASPGDYGFVIPTINSYVKVLYSKYQNPFVVQYQDIGHSINNIVTDNNTVSTITDSAGLTFSSGDVVHNINSNNHLLNAGLTSSIFIDTSNINMVINQGANLNLNTKFNLQSSNGCTIGGDTLLTLQNENANLKTLLSNVYTVLNAIAGVTIPSGGGQIEAIATATDPTFVTTLLQINSDISNLLA